MNIKKLFATLAGVSLFAQTVVPFGALAATYSAELQDAYDWAYGKWVTTMSSIDNANMYGAITRAEMAKMLSVYATEVLGYEADASKACNFTDIDSVKGDLHDYIIKSCQLGLMGQGITAFRPYDTISRAEFGTALSRTLWGDKYEGGTPYYANHLNALKAAGIMNQISNAESMKEVRGYVMLMLMRSEGGNASEKADCDDPAIALACSLESDSCPAECKASEEKDSDTVVKAGDLDVTAAGNSDGRLFIGRASDLDTITLKTSEEVTISRIILERQGYSVRENIKSVWLEDENGTKIADGKTPDSKGQVKLTLKKDYKVVNGTLDAIVVVETYSACEAADSTTACAGVDKVAWTKLLQAGGTVGFKVVDVESTAKNVNISGKANTYSAIAYDGSKISFTFKKNADKDYNWSAGETYEVAKFKVNAPEDSSIIVRGFTFKNTAATNALDLRKYFDSAEVTIAGEKVSGLNASVNKDDELVLTFKDTEIASKQKAEVIVKIALVEDFDQFGNNVALTMKDYVAVDGKVESRVANQTDFTELTTYAFKWGKVKLSSTKLGNVDAALESDDIVVAEGNITIPEAIKGTFTIRASGAGSNAIKEMSVSINGEETDATRSCTGIANTPDESDYCDFTFSNVEIDKSGKVKFLIDTINSNSTTSVYNTKTIKFDSFNADSFKKADDVKYDESGKTAKSEISGTISFSKVTIQPAKASMTNSITKEVEFANSESNTKVVFDGTYTAKKGDVYLNEFSIKSNSATADIAELLSWSVTTNKVTFYVYIDDSEVADGKLACTVASGCTAGDTFNNVLVKAGESVKVRIEAEVEAKNKLNGDETKFYSGATSLDLGKYQVKVQWEDVNGNSNSWVGTANTVALKVVVKGTVNISAGTTKETVLYKAAGAEVAAFNIKPANGSSETDLEEIKFTLAKSGTSLEPVVPTTENVVDGYVTVKVGGTNADCSKGTDDKVIVCSLNEKISSDGVDVKVTLENDEIGVIKLYDLYINGKKQTREFKKRFESALVWIDAMKDLGWTTQFTLGVEKDSDLTVRNLKLHFDAESSSGASDATVALDKVFDAGDTIEAKGMKDGVRLVDSIIYYATYDATDNACANTLRYNISDAWAETQANDGAYCKITIEKKDYTDFFKVGDSYARAYKSN